ncbi:hypothetical protein BGZ81_006765 [Podila clonocystis]|nr:hypothetical protein BGZ81_006765 [Podila clonocystis]
MQQQQQPSQPSQSSHGTVLTNIDPVLEGTINKFVRSEKYARKIKYIVRGTSVPGRQNYKFAPATALTVQETRIWRQNLMQDEIASNNPFWTARWMRVFGVAPKLDDSLLKVPWIKCERTKAPEGDTRAVLPLHRIETYLDLRDEQNRNWAMDSYAMGIQCAQNGQLENALKAYSQSIQIDSKSVDAYIARGCTSAGGRKHTTHNYPSKFVLNRLANMSKFKEAIMDFRQALTLQPSSDQARKYLDTTIAQEEYMRLNPQDQKSSNQTTHTSGQTGAYYPQSNLDDINEIVLDTEEMNANEDYNNRNDEDRNKKKKKKKSKRKRGRENIDRPDDRSRREQAEVDKKPHQEQIQEPYQDSDKEPSGEKARCQESNTGSVEKSCERSTQNSLKAKVKESCTPYSTSIQDPFEETLKESCTSSATSIQDSLKATIKKSSVIYTASIQESQKAVKESSTAHTTSIQESQKARGGSFYPLEKRVSTRDSKDENNTKNDKDSKDAKDIKDTKNPRDFKEDKSNRDINNLASKGEKASSSKKVESTNDTVYFMRVNIDAQKELKADAKGGKDATTTMGVTKNSKETTNKDDKDGSKRPMDDSRRDEESKRYRTLSPEHRRSLHHNSHNHRDRSRSRSRSENRDDSKSGGRRRPLPSQSDLRRAQASGSGGGGGGGSGGNNRNRGGRNRSRSPRRSSK